MSQDSERVLLGGAGSKHPGGCSKAVRKNCSHLKVLWSGKICFQDAHSRWQTQAAFPEEAPGVHKDSPEDSLSVSEMQPWLPPAQVLQESKKEATD